MIQPSADELVTLVVKHRVRAGSEEGYEAWLRRIVGVAQGFPGHLGVNVIRGQEAGLKTFTSVLRFCSTDLLQQWLDSADRLALVREAEPMLADGDQTSVANLGEFWFTPSADEAPAPPPRWKQAVVTLCVILPLTLLVPLAWGPIFQLHALLANYVISTFLVTVTIVLLVVYWLMPAATRLFTPWLSTSNSTDKDTL